MANSWDDKYLYGQYLLLFDKSAIFSSCKIITSDHRKAILAFFGHIEDHHTFLLFILQNDSKSNVVLSAKLHDDTNKGFENFNGRLYQSRVSEQREKESKEGKKNDPQEVWSIVM